MGVDTCAIEAAKRFASFKARMIPAAGLVPNSKHEPRRAAMLQRVIVFPSFRRIACIYAASLFHV
jgi:hypothetical protein